MATELPMAGPGTGMAGEKRSLGFLTDATLCIGCKACEVACKQWNQLPLDGLDLTANSYDNTTDLGATTWRHVAFVERGDELSTHPESRNATHDHEEDRKAGDDKAQAQRVVVFHQALHGPRQERRIQGLPHFQQQGLVEVV